MMNESRTDQTLQDQHLDLMIRLVFQKDNEEEIQKLVEAADPAVTTEDHLIGWNSLQKAFRVANKEKIELKKQNLRKKTKEVIFCLFQIVAAILVFLGISLSVSYAALPQFRAVVRKIVIATSEEKKEAYFTFSEDKTTSFEVPGEWNGLYFPFYIPENMSLDYSVYSTGTTIEFSGSENQMIVFSEMDQNTGLTVGTESTDISTVFLNQSDKAYLIDGYYNEIHCVTLIWSADSNWFHLITYNIETSKALEVAESVKKINME